jgi:(2Fe-2S) ferredoxin
MNNLESHRTQARAAWNRLKLSNLPTIHLGMASCGRAAGAPQVLSEVEAILAENSLTANIIQVGCIGPCYLEPLMDITLPGKPRISYANMTQEKTRIIVESSLLRGDTQSKMAVGYFDGPGDKYYDGIPRFFDLPMLKSQVRVVLRNCGFINP